jgi:hypothetical protein
MRPAYCMGVVWQNMELGTVIQRLIKSNSSTIAPAPNMHNDSRLAYFTFVRTS